MNRYNHIENKSCKGTVKFYAFLFISLFGLILPSKSQLPDYQLQLFDYTSGIQPGTIVSVGKDNKGFLWILYQRQMQRFDGRQVSTFKLKDNFYHMLCDKSGNIWVASYKQVLLYSEAKREFEEIGIKSKDSSFLLGDIIQLPDNKIWLLGSSSFFEYDSVQHLFTTVKEKLSLPAPYNVRFFANYGNSLFTLNGDNIYRFNRNTKQLDSLPSLLVNKILPLNEDSALISVWNNRSYWYNFLSKKISPATIPPPFRENNNPFISVRSVAEFSPNRYLVAAREGIFEYNNKLQQFKPLQFFFNGRKVATNDYTNYVTVDKEGYAWMASIDGVARFSIQHSLIGLLRIRQLNDALPASIDNIRQMAEDEKGNLWLATADGVVCRQKETNDWKYFLPAPDRTDRLAHPSVRGLVYDGKYLIIAPTDLGVWLLDPHTGKFRRPLYADPETKKSSEGDFFSHILTLHNGTHLFSARDALYVMDAKTYTMRLLKLSSSVGNASCSFQEGNGIVWLTTIRGLFCLDSNLNYLCKVELPFKNASNPVAGGFALPGNKLLFGSLGGLFTATYNDKKVTLQKTTPVFDNILLTTLYQDKKGIIWASSENGIYRFDPSTSKLNLFDHSDNVQGYGFSNNSWLLNKEGTLFLGGVNGVNYLRPNDYSKPDELLKVYIHKIRIGNGDSAIYSFDQKPFIRYSERSLEVEFVTPYFNNPAKVKYRYRLKGYDADWFNAGNNNLVRFTSLSPGDYTLYVQASLNDVDWVDAQNNFAFRIAAPFWQRWWFYLLFAASLSLIFYLFVKNRNKKIQEKQEELEAEQAINYFANSMSEQQTAEDILWDVAKNCIGRLQFEDCVIYLVNEQNGMLVQKAAHGPKSPEQYELNKPIGLPFGTGIVGTVALSGKAEIVNDTSKDLRYVVDDERRFSEITVPIISDGKVLGVIDCEHSKKGFFTQKHLSILTTIASLCANKIVRARAEDEKEQAHKILMDTKEKMADAEMQALRAQMNPHFIFNCLNSINRYIVKSDQVTASLYLTRFAKLIRLILDNSNSKNVNLSNELEALKLYIEMEMLRFDKKFNYRVTVDDDINPDSIELPPLIIQPYVENAIWHGLLHKETGGNLSIHVSMIGDNILVCEIEDDGVGREKAMELKSKSATTRKSLGMKLTEDRISLLNKHAELNASVDIIDLKNENGEAKGTRVILKIPI